uniref:Uncharacterized protein n=1 Tax=Magnetospirillum gryphiswaldense TaxID=55518 RepID=A4TTM4_9PROT|nr:hypothetical protein MGR_3529 [Magnetospirillum gryphiswaldense MSR-1]
MLVEDSTRAIRGGFEEIPDRRGEAPQFPAVRVRGSLRNGDPGIPIDVRYRFFWPEKRSFFRADRPGPNHPPPLGDRGLKPPTYRP